MSARLVNMISVLWVKTPTVTQLSLEFSSC